LALEQRDSELTAVQVEALQVATRQLQQASGQLDTDRALGRVALTANRLDEAEYYLLRRLDAVPDDVITHYFLGETYFRQGQLAAALEQWAAARATRRLFTVAQDLVKREQPMEALAVLEMIMALEPTNLAARQQAGDLWRKQGQAQCQLDHPAEARLAYAHAIELGQQAESIRQAVDYIAQHGSCPETVSGKK
jgi:tetratricopeptide (TPR) repeat protein